MPVDFKQLLSKPLDDVKRPPAFPPGTYYGTINAFKYAESRFADKETQEKNAVVNLTLAQVRPGEDVDQALMGDMDISKKQFFAELPLSGGYEWTTKALLDGLGINTAGRGFGETIPELLNHEVMFTVTQRADKNDVSVMYNDVRSVRAVPAQAAV